MARLGCSGMRAASVSPMACASSDSSDATTRVMEQARSTPASPSPCLPSETHRSAMSCRMRSGAMVPPAVPIARERWCRRQCPSGLPPDVPAARQHVVGGLGPPGAGGVIGEVELVFVPDGLDGVDYGPTGFQHVLAGVESGVTDDDVE